MFEKNVPSLSISKFPLELKISGFRVTGFVTGTRDQLLWRIHGTDFAEQVKRTTGRPSGGSASGG